MSGRPSTGTDTAPPATRSAAERISLNCVLGTPGDHAGTVDEAIALTAERGVNAVAVCSYIPGAKSVWMAACVPLTADEVENSVMAPVFIPLAKHQPIPGIV